MTDDRMVLFYTNYRKFHGGHLKLRDYIDHVEATPGFTPRIYFSPKTVFDDMNPYAPLRDRAIDPATADADVHFVAGVGWAMFDRFFPVPPPQPVLNLVQHVRHADPENARFEYLKRRAIRIGVSDEVAEELRASGETIGSVVAIPNGIPAFTLPDAASARDLDLLVIAMKQPALGQTVAAQLAAPGRSVELLDAVTPRAAFMHAMQRARATIFIPNPTEGFYLPALEGMALGTLVICPDVIGNRGFCRPDETALMPAFTAEGLVAAGEAALALPADQRAAMLTSAAAMAERHTLASERAAFQALLGRLDQEWSGHE